MRSMRTIVAILLVALLSGPSFGQMDRTSILVDMTKSKGPMRPVWCFFGYDEPNCNC